MKYTTLYSLAIITLSILNTCNNEKNIKKDVITIEDGLSNL